MHGQRDLSVGHAVSFRLGSSGPMSTTAPLVLVWKEDHGCRRYVYTVYGYSVAFSGPTPTPGAWLSTSAIDHKCVYCSILHIYTHE